PFQDHYPARSAASVIYPLWAFPDLYHEPLDLNPRFLWAEMAQTVGLILTANSFTAEVLARAGVRTPIRVVPPPVRQEWFTVPPWEGPREVELPWRCQILDSDTASAVAVPPRRPRSWPWGSRNVRTFYLYWVRPRIPPLVARWKTAFLQLV